jgi:hypothetical protein
MPSTIGWNATMMLNKIFDQLIIPTYGKPTPSAIHQNNLTFIPVYSSKDPPELLLKRCADCQEIAITAKVPANARDRRGPFHLLRPFCL